MLGHHGVFLGPRECISVCSVCACVGRCACDHGIRLSVHLLLAFDFPANLSLHVESSLALVLQSRRREAESHPLHAHAPLLQSSCLWSSQALVCGQIQPQRDHGRSTVGNLRMAVGPGSGRSVMEEGSTPELPGIWESLEEAPEKKGEDGRVGVHRPVCKAVREARMKHRGTSQQQQRSRMVPQECAPSPPRGRWPSCEASASRGRPGPSHQLAVSGGNTEMGTSSRESSPGLRISVGTQRAASESAHLGKVMGRAGGVLAETQSETKFNSQSL